MDCWESEPFVKDRYSDAATPVHPHSGLRSTRSCSRDDPGDPARRLETAGRRRVVGYRPEGQPRQASRTGRGTRRTAESKLAKFVVEAGRGQALVGSTTVATYLEQWMGHVRAHRQPDPARNYALRCRRLSDRTH